MPRAVITMGPTSPALVSAISSVCEWYIHITEEPSIGPGPARSGTFQLYVNVSPGATASSALAGAPVPSAYGAPSAFFS